MGFIHADFSGGQISYVTYAGLHHVFVSQKFLDGLHLGRRFHDNQILAHSSLTSRNFNERNASVVKEHT